MGLSHLLHPDFLISGISKRGAQWCLGEVGLGLESAPALVFTVRKAGFEPFPSFLESLCSCHWLCPPLEPVRGSQQCFPCLLMTLRAPPNNYPADLSGVSLLKLHSCIFSLFSFYIFAGEQDNSSPRLSLAPGLAWALLVSRTSN